MMISELSYLHLQRSEEERIERELERRREQLERQAAQDAAPTRPAGTRAPGRSWWAGVLHVHPRHGADASHEHAHAA